MDMTPQTAWLIAAAAVVVVGVLAFFVGRRSAGGNQARINELEAELRSRQEQMDSELRSKQQEIDAYRKDVETHFDRTATLFVSMAGSYKDLFEHLSGGYEKLSTGSARELFQQRVDALLLGSTRRADAEAERNILLSGAVGAASAAGLAAAQASDAPYPASPPPSMVPTGEDAVTAADALSAAAATDPASEETDEIMRQAEGDNVDFQATSPAAEEERANGHA